MSLALFAGFSLQAAPASATFPGSRDEIAVVRVLNGISEIHAFDPNHGFSATNEHALVVLPDRDAVEPAWSSDGERLAFAARVSPGGPFAIYTANADGSGVAQVTSGSAGDTNPAWSPDGDRIAFARSMVGGSHAIFIVPSDGEGSPTPFTDGSLDESQPAWSPDGSEIAYSAYQIPPTLCPDCRRVITVRAVAGGSPRFLTSLSFDAGDPDWSPDGSHIAYALTAPEPDGTIESLVRIVQSSPPYAYTEITLLASNTSHPSWSPDGAAIAYETSGTFAGVVANETRSGGQPLAFLEGVSDPAWRSVEGTPPTITYDQHPNEFGWFGRNTSIGVTATDPDGVLSLVCIEGGEVAGPHITSVTPQSISGSIPLFNPGIDVPITCTATDGLRASGIASTTVDLDVELPVASGVTMGTTLLRSSQSTSVVADATDDLSGVARGTIETLGQFGGPGPVFPMTLSDGRLSGSIDPGLVADVYLIRARAVDRADNVGALSTGVSLIVYDPLAGSVDGTGWIVPGGPTSDPGDVLPCLDGRTKASFTISAKYKTATSSTPSGRLSLNCGNPFKFQSTNLSWLIVRQPDTALLEGTGAIQGMVGTFTFRASIRDGGTRGTDHLALRLWPLASSPDGTNPTYQASGDVGGQLQITS